MFYRMQASRHRPRRATASALAEFGPVMFILLVVVLLPMVGMFSYFDAVATACLCAISCARDGAVATTGSQALSVMTARASQVLQGPLGKFANLTGASGGPPNPNATGGGDIKVSVLVTPADGGATTTYTTLGPSGHIPNSPDTVVDNNIYQLVVQCNLKARPLFIPGGPYPCGYTAQSQIEHPEGLNN